MVSFFFIGVITHKLVNEEILMQKVYSISNKYNKQKSLPSILGQHRQSSFFKPLIQTKLTKAD
jgi:hypothetical protein